MLQKFKPEIKKSKKINNKKCFQRALKITWLQFASRTQTHGMKYIVDPNGNYFTKLIWVGIVIGAFIAANAMVGTFWTRYKSNPTRMNVQSNHEPSQLLPFPGITLCSSTRISETKSREFVNTL